MHSRSSDCVALAAWARNHRRRRPPRRRQRQKSRRVEVAVGSGLEAVGDSAGAGDASDLSRAAAAARRAAAEAAAAEQVALAAEDEARRQQQRLRGAQAAAPDLRCRPGVVADTDTDTDASQRCRLRPERQQQKWHRRACACSRRYGTHVLLADPRTRLLGASAALLVPFWGLSRRHAMEDVLKGPLPSGMGTAARAGDGAAAAEAGLAVALRFAASLDERRHACRLAFDSMDRTCTRHVAAAGAGAGGGAADGAAGAPPLTFGMWCEEHTEDGALPVERLKGRSLAVLTATARATNASAALGSQTHMAAAAAETAAAVHAIELSEVQEWAVPAMVFDGFGAGAAQTRFEVAQRRASAPREQWPVDESLLTMRGTALARARDAALSRAAPPAHPCACGGRRRRGAPVCAGCVTFARPPVHAPIGARSVQSRPAFPATRSPFPYGRGAGRGARLRRLRCFALRRAYRGDGCRFHHHRGRVAWGRIRDEVALPEVERTKLRDACKEPMISLGAESKTAT